MIYIEDAGVSEIPAIQEIAVKTWWPTYTPILSREQIQFMLDYLYSFNELAQAMEKDLQKFLIIKDSQEMIHGFASYGVKEKEPLIYKLYKLYILPDNHGKGYGKLLIDEIQKRIIPLGAFALDLNVNRYNPAISFYKKLGFNTIEEIDVPIGPYWMNDYVMRLRLG